MLELERGLNITEEVHASPGHPRRAAHRRAPADRGRRRGRAGRRGRRRSLRRPTTMDDMDLDTEFIDESESEAAPAATDR